MAEAVDVPRPMKAAWRDFYISQAMATLQEREAMTTLLQALSPRQDRRTVKKALRQIHRELRDTIASIAPYKGGLKAEIESANNIKSQAHKAAVLASRKAWLSRQGRKIDLVGLMNQRRADGLPVWALRDPMVAIVNSSNGKYDTDSTLCIGNSWVKFKGLKTIHTEKGNIALIPVGGIPPLPQEARALASDPKIRKRAAWLGLLYQPEEWRQVKPDPAIVVEWKDLPGEYFALCVWGGDMPRIMEFVD